MSVERLSKPPAVGRRFRLALLLVAAFGLAGCRAPTDDERTVVVAIESSPNSLDLRVGTDAQSERLGGLLFDALVRKDEHFELRPWLAESWEQPDPLTWIFHLRDGVRFHDGRPLEAADVAWTIQSMMDGTVITSKGGAFQQVAQIETPDRRTVTLHLKRPDAGILFNMSDGLFGVVPRGSGRDFGQHPVGSGPFRFATATQDRDVVVERNPAYWAGPPRIERIRFAVTPDAITTALELERGSADAESNAITLDEVHALVGRPNLRLESAPGSVVVYANFNLSDPVLRDRRVRQAVACSIDRQAIVDALWRGQARLADSLLPPGHWARADEADLPLYPHDLVRARHLLDEAGYPPGKNGVRLRFTLKTSTDETTRLMAAVLQQQMRAAGIALDLRSSEFGTFYADITKGAFQMYVLRWIGSNEDPDIFRYAYGSASMPPRGGNRGRYSNARVDALLNEAGAARDPTVRQKDYVAVQQILAEDLPGIPLWYPNTEVLHTKRLNDVHVTASGNFDWLRDAWVR